MINMSGTRKGIAPLTVIALLFVTISLGAIAYSAAQVTNLLTLILNNLFWFAFGAIMIGIIGILISQSIKGELTSEQTFLGIAILVIAMIGIPIAGLTIDNVTSSYQADVTVEVDQHIVGLDQPKLENVQVDDVEETGLRIFSLVNTEQQFCLWGCDEWQVDVTMTCDGDTIGEYTVSSAGSETATRTIGGLPGDAQCEATATPSTGITGTTTSSSFITR